MGMMLSPDGLAVGVDHIPELKEMAERNIRRGNPDLLAANVELVGKFLNDSNSNSVTTKLKSLVVTIIINKT